MATASAHVAARRIPGGFRWVVVLVVGSVVALGGCAGSDERSTGETERSAKPIAKEELLRLPKATTFGDIPEAPTDPSPQAPTTGTVLHVQDEIPVYDGKNGAPIARMPTKQLGSPTWLAVIDKQNGWYQVLLPSRPNKSTGWIHADDGTLKEANTDYLVTVDLDHFRLRVSENGQDRGVWEIGIGKSEYPTPTGRTAIISSLKETVEQWSPIVLPMGSHSDSHDTFGGGPGTVALHGWPDDSVFGTKTSDGCIRVPDDALELLATLPLGTTVIVT